MRASLVILPLVLLASQTPEANAQVIDGFSPARTVAVSGADAEGNLFGETKTTVPIPGTTQITPYYGGLDESAEGFGTSASSTLAAFADQQSTIAPTLDELGGSPIRLRGSASLSASFDEAGQLEGRAFSRIQWEFTVASETAVQLSWALAATSTGPDTPSRFFNGITLSLGDGTSQGVFFFQSAGLEQTNAGDESLVFGPGSYYLYLSADLDFMPEFSGSGLPVEFARSAAFEVNIAIVPAPASAVLPPLGWFTAVRRHRRRGVPT